MRLLELGGQSALRSQTVYHAIAYGVSAGAPDTLCLMHPVEPYVCLGFHRSHAELDLRECRRRGLRVLRRRLGGGPVYLDSDQLFFQIVVHASRAPFSVEDSYRAFLTPAVTAFRRLGIAASLHGTNDICVQGRKLSGTGMARIEDAVVCVGNVIFDFDFDAMVSVLAIDDATRGAFARLQSRYLTTVRRELGREVTRDEVRDAIVTAYADGLGTELVPGELTPVERERVEELDALFTSPEWLEDGDAVPAGARQVKVRGGASVFATRVARGGTELRATVSLVDGRVADVQFSSPGWRASPAALDVVSTAFRGLSAQRDILLGAARRSWSGVIAPVLPEDLVDCVMLAEQGRAG